MTSWIDVTYTIISLIVTGLLMYVMQKTERDRINKIDGNVIQTLRRLAFIVAALVLLYSISSVNWQLTCLLLVGSSGALLAINAVALHFRTPPNNRGKIFVELKKQEQKRI